QYSIVMPRCISYFFTQPFKSSSLLPLEVLQRLEKTTQPAASPGSRGRGGQPAAAHHALLTLAKPQAEQTENQSILHFFKKGLSNFYLLVSYLHWKKIWKS